jgi:hypothetical protein
MAMKTLKVQCFSTVVLFLSLFVDIAAHAQITPTGDAYTNSATPTTNYGAKTLLDVDAASQISYIQFDLASIPSGASVGQATLKLYVNSVITAGSFNVNFVNVTWSEGTITSSNAPPQGNTLPQVSRSPQRRKMSTSSLMSLRRCRRGSTAVSPTTAWRGFSSFNRENCSFLRLGTALTIPTYSESGRHS